jgi:hypothetical protein
MRIDILSMYCSLLSIISHIHANTHTQGKLDIDMRRYFERVLEFLIDLITQINIHANTHTHSKLDMDMRRYFERVLEFLIDLIAQLDIHANTHTHRASSITSHS